MTSKTEKDKAKQLQDKCQSVLNTLLRDEDNKYCVDCDSKGPRWASWNLGVFLCIRCAGIHRNLGVHISKVKSVNLDAWTPEQVVSLQQMGNSRARAVYEANLPDNFRRPQSDSSLESFIRAKYEHKKYIAREWVPPTLPKVNWEKEIEEEMEKQKRKKKTIVEKKTVNSVEVPQLPKPKNPSPKPSAVSQATASEAKPNSDLLGLQNGEDGFSGFLSAPTTQAKEKPEQDSSKSEEESFFNQTAPTEKEKVKLTKDSILALYGNTPPVNNFNSAFQNQVPFQQPQQQAVPKQNNFQNFTVFSQQPYPVQPVAPVQQVAANSVPFQSQSFQNWGTTPTPNYFQMQPQVNQFATPNQFQTAPNQYQSHNQFQPNVNVSAPNQYSQFNQFQQTNFIGPTPNPFCSSNQTTASLQQQFSTLSVGNQNPTNPTPTLTGHLWQ